MNQTICLNMIVKNEAKAIEACLASVKNRIDYWVIVDTGSTDGTQSIIQKFFRDIPGELYERPWVDFAFNRNGALQLAKNKGDYLLFIDADERLEFTDSSGFSDLDQDYYVSIYHQGSTLSLRTLLVHSRFDWKWTGIIHEIVECPEAKKVGFLDRVVNRATLYGCRSRDLSKKFWQDIELLEQVVQNDPQNARARFHLAMHYESVHEPVLAHKNYEMRSMMGGLNPEVFYSWYRIGMLQKELKISSATFINSFLKTFHFRPWRAEPLFCLADYFMENNVWFLGYLITKYAVSAYLFNDYYLVSNKIYDYGLFYQFAECSFRVGKYQDAYEGLTRLLAARDLPTDIRECSEKNLSLLRDQQRITVPVVE
jgi:glycosyltransferase involved in cell wall biosynthesis